MVENQSEKCIFCSIFSGNTPSIKVGENSDSISVLEINPISKGHSLVIPKKHVSLSDDLQEGISKIVQEVSNKISKEFSPKEIIIAKTSLFGHEVINIIPIYNSEDINSKRYSASKQELEEVKKKLTKKTTEKVKISKKDKEIVKKTEKIEKINSKTDWLPKRIP